MKLEPKHIAPYLPYHLLCTDGRISALKNHVGWTVTVKRDEEDYIGLSIIIHKVVPMLRPLSKIDWNEITKMFMDPPMQIKNEFAEGMFWVGLKYQDETKVPIYDYDLQLMPDCPYLVYQYLVKNHFDIFNLIGKGLAVEITE